MKKIAYIMHYVTNGGPSNVVKNIIYNLDRQMYQPTLITLFKGNDSQIISEYKKMGIQVIECNYDSKIKVLLGKNHLKDILIREKIEIAHSHGFVCDILLSRMMDKKLIRISTVHSNIFQDYVYTYGKVKAAIIIPVYIHFLKKMDKVVLCSKYASELLSKYIKKCVYVYNGINDTKVCTSISREELGIRKNESIFIYVGGLRAVKNVSGLIELFCLHSKKDEHLLIVGDGEEQNTCRKLANERVHFLGYKEDPVPYLRISNCFISASFSEGMPLAVLEALDNGLPLVLSSIPAHEEIFEIYSAQYIGELFSKNTFAECMQSFRDNFSIISSENIIETKKQFFSSFNMVKKYSYIYESLEKIQ